MPVHTLFYSFALIIFISAICRNRRTNQRDVLMKECSYYQTKIKNLENQNFLLKNTKIKLKEMLTGINYIPFQQNQNSNQGNLVIE